MPSSAMSRLAASASLEPQVPQTAAVLGPGAIVTRTIEAGALGSVSLSRTAKSSCQA